MIEIVPVANAQCPSFMVANEFKSCDFLVGESDPALKLLKQQLFKLSRVLGIYNTLAHPENPVVSAIEWIDLRVVKRTGEQELPEEKQIPSMRLFKADDNKLFLTQKSACLSVNPHDHPWHILLFLTSKDGLGFYAPNKADLLWQKLTDNLKHFVEDTSTSVFNNYGVYHSLNLNKNWLARNNLTTQTLFDDLNGGKTLLLYKHPQTDQLVPVLVGKMVLADLVRKQDFKAVPLVEKLRLLEQALGLAPDSLARIMEVQRKELGWFEKIDYTISAASETIEKGVRWFCGV